MVFISPSRIWPFRSYYSSITRGLHRLWTQQQWQDGDGQQSSCELIEGKRESGSARDGKYGSQIVHWHPTAVLAQHQEPDGQLAISSRQVEVYKPSISHIQTLPFLFSPSILCSNAYFLSPAPVTTRLLGHLSETPDPPRGPVQAIWHSL